MLQKLFILFVIVVILRPACKLSSGANINSNGNIFNMSDAMVTKAEGTWRPIYQTQNWLSTPRLPMATTSYREDLNLGNKVKETSIYKNQNNTNTQIHHNYAASNVHPQHTNYGTNVRRTLTSAPPLPIAATPFQQSVKDIISITSLTSGILMPRPPASITPLPSAKNIKSMTRVFPSNISNNNTTSSSQGRDKYLSNCQHHYQRQTNNIIFPKTQTPLEIIQQKTLSLGHHAMNTKYSISTQANVNPLDNIPQYRKLTTNSSSEEIYWQNAQAAKHVKPQKHNDKIIFSANFTDNILPAKINFFRNNENLIDNNTANFENHNETTLTHKKVKSQKVDDRSPSDVIKSGSDNTATNAAIDDEVSFHGETFLRRALKGARESYYSIKDKITRQNNKEIDESANDNDYDMKLNEDNTNSENRLLIFNSSSQHTPKDTSKAAASLRKLDSLNVKNILPSLLPSTGNDNVLKRQIDKNHMKDALVKPPLKYSTLSLTPNVQDTNEASKISSQSTPTMEAQLQNLSTGDKTLSILPPPSTTPTSSLLSASTSKDLRVNSSGRKIKKIKKEFEKFLLPLVLAYKLKYMVLIPLLCGGLILLVGSTGLAGFFFALFTAVMTIKTGHKDAVFVQKY